ncbi:MAG: hypothetical protein Q4B54_09985 [Coriobacteriales bacterium]|nr:hypothetical protein [Coriobacteriales bacterium]
MARAERAPRPPGGAPGGAATGDAPFAATDDTDWLCDYCGSYNPATLENCRYCAASREMSSGKTYQQIAGKMARTYDAQGNLVAERDLSKPKATSPKPTPKAGGGFSFSDIPGCFKFLIVLLGIVGLIYLLHFIFYAPKPRDITVDAFDWQQTIQIEELQTVDDSGWTLPEGGRLVTTREEVSGYNHVLDHYETETYEVSERVIDHYETYTTTVDNGDGSFEVEEHREPVYTTQTRTEEREVPVYVDIPIYDTKYYYKIEKWVPTRTVDTSGTDHSPTWGEVKLSGATGEHGTGAEREGARSGTYGVTDSEGNHYTADLEFWQSLEQGQTLSVMVDGEGHMTPKG